MKKILSMIICLFLVSSFLSACEDYTLGKAESYPISYSSEVADLLMDGYAPTDAAPGEMVVLRTHPLMDADLMLYSNDNLITCTYSDSDYWEYCFVMPDRDVAITSVVSEGFYEVIDLTRYQSWLLDLDSKEIAEIKTIFSFQGTRPGSLKSVCRTEDQEAIADMVSNYQELKMQRIPDSESQIDGGSSFSVTFLLSNGQEYTLDFYHQILYIPQCSYGAYFLMESTPSLSGYQNVTCSNTFVTYIHTASILDKNEVCIGVIERLDILEFVSASAPENSDYSYRIDTEFGILLAYDEQIFAFDDDPATYYQLTNCCWEDFLFTNQSR